MVSLGTQAYCDELVATTIKCSGIITASHKVFGAAQNQGQMHHHGSIFYIKWSAVHQCSSLATTSGSSTVTWTTTAAHGFEVGDTIHISSIPNNPGVITAVNGILSSDLKGPHVILTLPSTTTFSVSVATNADTTGSSTVAVPFVRRDRYRYTDMASNDTTWSNATTVPTPSHTNTETFVL